MGRATEDRALPAPPASENPAIRLRERLDEIATRRGLAVDPAEALGWVRSWWDEAAARRDDPPPVRDLVVDNAAWYAAWHALGPTRGSQPGFLALSRLAIREAGSVERGTEAASETWLDVRTRLEQTVDRAADGRSIPDFSGPTEIGEDNCHRYHGIQARLRVRGKWSRTKATEVYEEGRHAAEWRVAYQAAEARTYALPLHFAAWWVLLDTKERTTRDGRTKGVAWWWSMLMHALDLEKTDDLGGDRNDPTEALLRLRLRFAAAQGLAGWLRRWSADHPYWSQVEFGLPDPENAAARQAAQEALDAIRPALDRAIHRIEASADERRVLQGTLMRGENVRTASGKVAGSDASDRQARLFVLGEQAGRLAAEQLGGRGGTSGGGGGGHRHVDAVIARLAAGAVPSVEDTRVLSAAVAECGLCRERWIGQVDAGPYLDGVVDAPLPERRRVPRWALAGGLALVVGLVAVVVAGPGQPDIGLRGGEGTVAPSLDLVVQRVGGGPSERFDPARTYARGDTVFFVVAADQEVELGIRVSGPEGTADLGVRPIGPERGTFGGDEAVWYRFDRSGTYRFAASTLPDGPCEPETCVERVVEVGP